MSIVRSAAASRLVLLVATSPFSFLTGCGGGGNGSSEPFGNGLSLELEPKSLSATVYRGDVTNFAVTANVRGTTSGNVYVLVTDPKGTFNRDIPISQMSSTAYAATFTTSQTLAVGDHPGDIHVELCGDSNCQNVLAAADLSYDIKVLNSSNQTPLTSLEGAGDWSTYQRDAAHSGYVPVTVAPSQFTVRWIWDSPNQNGQSVSSGKLVAAGGFVYATETIQPGTGDPILFSLNESTGVPGWTADFGVGSYVFDPAVSNGNVYVSSHIGGSSGNFYGFSASSGNQIFKTSVEAQYCCYGAPVGYGGDVFELGGFAASPYAFNGTTGAIEWSPDPYQTSQFNQAVPAVDANNFYFFSINNGGGADETFYVLNKANGTTVNLLQDSGSATGGAQFTRTPGHSLALVGSNNAIVNTQTHLDNFQISPIALAWSISGDFVGDTAVANGVIYVQSANPYQLQARNFSDGSLSWTWSPSAPAQSNQQAFGAAPIVTNNLVILSTGTEVDAIDLSTHNVVWSYPGPASDLVISTNGILYFNRTGAPGIVVAVNLR